jgi:hypothetical protein
LIRGKQTLQTVATVATNSSKCGRGVEIPDYLVRGKLQTASTSQTVTTTNKLVVTIPNNLN